MGYGIYQKLVDYAGAGATVPLTGFGNLLAKGAIKKAETDGLIGAFTGRYSSSCWWNCSGNILWLYCFTCCKTKNEKAIKNKLCFAEFIFYCLFFNICINNINAINIPIPIPIIAGNLFSF